MTKTEATKYLSSRKNITELVKMTCAIAVRRLEEDREAIYRGKSAFFREKNPVNVDQDNMSDAVAEALDEKGIDQELDNMWDIAIYRLIANEAWMSLYSMGVAPDLQNQDSDGITNPKPGKVMTIGEFFKAG